MSSDRPNLDRYNPSKRGPEDGEHYERKRGRYDDDRDSEHSYDLSERQPSRHYKDRDMNEKDRRDLIFGGSDRPERSNPSYHRESMGSRPDFGGNANLQPLGQDGPPGEDEKPEFTPEEIEFKEKLQEKLPEICAKRSELPIHSMKQNILDAILWNRVSIITGATGTGKSTQVPQYLLEFADEHKIECKILVAQPRRLAATSLANRVAFERGDIVGHDIGYIIGGRNQVTPKSRLIFATTGVLREMLISDKKLSKYTHIILDEVHERHTDTDLCFVCLREILNHNPNVHIVLMSATLNTTQFSNYFTGGPPGSGPMAGKVPATCYIPTRGHPVRQYYLDDLPGILGKDSVPDRFLLVNPPRSPSITPARWEAGMSLVHHLHRALPLERAILVFLPGIVAIGQCHDELLRTDREGVLQLIQLHSTTGIEDQFKALSPPAKPGMRKIILATNIAESSITVPDVSVVIDFMLEKRTHWNPVNQVSTLDETWISRDAADQRMGRAGRVGPGLAYRMISRSQFAELDDHTLPEIQRTDLAMVILKLLRMNWGSPTHFLATCMAPPSSEAINTGYRDLCDLGAIVTMSIAEEEARLTNVIEARQHREERRKAMEETPRESPENKLARPPREPLPPLKRATMTGPDGVVIPCFEGDTIPRYCGYRITKLGALLSRLPLDIPVAMLIVYGYVFNRLDDTIVLAALLTKGSPIMLNIEDPICTYELLLKHSRGARSDLLAGLHAYKDWVTDCKKGTFHESDEAMRNRYLQQRQLSLPHLREIQSMVVQLRDTLSRYGICDPPSEEERTALREARRHSVPMSLASEMLTMSVSATTLDELGGPAEADLDDMNPERIVIPPHRVILDDGTDTPGGLPQVENWETDGKHRSFRLSSAYASRECQPDDTVLRLFIGAAFLPNMLVVDRAPWPAQLPPAFDVYRSIQVHGIPISLPVEVIAHHFEKWVGPVEHIVFDRHRTGRPVPRANPDHCGVAYIEFCAQGAVDGATGRPVNNPPLPPVDANKERILAPEVLKALKLRPSRASSLTFSYISAHNPMHVRPQTLFGRTPVTLDRHSVLCPALIGKNTKRIEDIAYVPALIQGHSNGFRLSAHSLTALPDCKHAVHALLLLFAHTVTECEVERKGKYTAYRFSAALKGRKHEFQIYLSKEDHDRVTDIRTYVTERINTALGQEQQGDSDNHDRPVRYDARVAKSSNAIPLGPGGPRDAFRGDHPPSDHDHGHDHDRPHHDDARDPPDRDAPRDRHCHDSRPAPARRLPFEPFNSAQNLMSFISANKIITHTKVRIGPPGKVRPVGDALLPMLGGAVVDDDEDEGLVFEDDNGGHMQVE